MKNCCSAQNEIKLMLRKNDFVDGTVIKKRKHLHFDSYMNFDLLKHKFDEMKTYFLSEEMAYKYNNQDHSMLTGFRAAINFLGKTSKR